MVLETKIKKDKKDFGFTVVYRHLMRSRSDLDVFESSCNYKKIDIRFFSW